MATVSFEQVRKEFGTAVVVHDFDLEVADGELVVLVGGSGCGKSTTLRMLAGLESVTAGTIRIGGRDVTHLPPQKRDVAMVFQDYALYPHLTARSNISLGLRLRRLPKDEIERRVSWAAELLDLAPSLERKPRQLSGGQRQRVAMGRAIVREPAVFLFDEPLSNLDAKLRSHMRVEIARLQRRLGTTTLYVTHDQVEAMTLADRVAVLDAGRIQQLGRPIDVYRSPANRFVAEFMGSPQMNFFGGRIESAGDGLAFVGDGLRVPLLEGRHPVRAAADGLVTLGVRPEDIALGSGISGRPALACELVRVELLGSTAHVHAERGEQRVTAVVSSDQRLPSAPGAISLALDPARIHLFGVDGRSLLEPYS